jgi:hypothetical protein
LQPPTFAPASKINGQQKESSLRRSFQRQRDGRRENAVGVDRNACVVSGSELLFMFVPIVGSS